MIRVRKWLIRCFFTSWDPDNNPRVSIFSFLNLILHERLPIAPYITPVLYIENSKG